MIRIGMVGSDNSHADAFSQLCNLSRDPRFKGQAVSGARVTHLFGIPEHEARTQEVAANNRIPHIVREVREMIGQVDAAMVVFRHGGLHLKYAKPLIEAGIPCFVDKPMTCSVKEAKALLSLAKRKNCPITSFSTYRISKDTADLAKALQQIGPITAGTLTGPCDIASEYGGLFFYGVHVVELMLALFGTGVKSVQATTHKGNTVGIVRYKTDRIVTLNLLYNAQYVFHILAFGKQGWKAHLPDGAGLYPQGLRLFLKMVKTGERPFSDAELLEPVQIMAALQQSLATGQEVALSEV
jgi:predicted dehydrogenase